MQIPEYSVMIMGAGLGYVIDFSINGLRAGG